MAPAQPSSSNANPPPTLSLNGQIMAKLKPAKIFKNCIDPPAQSSNKPPNNTPRNITGITFDDRGDSLVIAAEDESFRVYNCKTGKHQKLFYSKKYGIDLPRFTHKNTAIIHASTKEDDAIRYSSLHDNKFLQYFKGHKETVVSLEISPIDDGFMSGSMDRTVRLWDLRAPTCRGLLAVPAVPIVAYDSTGMVFAVGINQYSRILMYDQANYDKAPFLTVPLEDPTLAQISYPPRPICMTSMAFSTNGKHLLVGCSGNAHYVLDAYDGALIAKLEGHVGLERRSLNQQLGIEVQKGVSGEEVSWTPDSKYVVGGSLDGRILVWDLQNIPPRPEGSKSPVKLQPVTVLDGHPGPARCVKFNPRYAMMATAGQELAFWLPDQIADAEDGLLKKKSNA
ncbi:WD40-repeat-containing domain protein [Crepidotus variabilis]|uniref:WD40-repeat-containing domain protein n=1 Tax=Crepidotus variabilis TaxID=179855 RepID=A0A9P6EPL1_9AGAR|nr:WD40-repeat-containing domain protein [Crepidotus variabilis]